MARLVKSADKKIFGVCGGLANYFGIDPTIMRIIALILLLVYGVGGFAYLILAFVMPSK